MFYRIVFVSLILLLFFQFVSGIVNESEVGEYDSFRSEFNQPVIENKLECISVSQLFLVNFHPLNVRIFIFNNLSASSLKLGKLSQNIQIWRHGLKTSWNS